MPPNENPLVIEAPAIDDVFETTVASIRDAASKMIASSFEPSSSVRIAVDAVDLEITFKSVSVTKDGVLKKLVSSDKQTSSSLEIRLATRIRFDLIDKST